MTCEMHTPSFSPHDPRQHLQQSCAAKLLPSSSKQASKHPPTFNRKKAKQNETAMYLKTRVPPTFPDSCSVAQQAPAEMLRISCFQISGARCILAKLSSEAFFFLSVSEPSKPDLA